MVEKVNVEIAKHAPIKLGTMYLSLNVTDSLALDTGFRLASPDMVAKLVSEFQTQMANPTIATFVRDHFDQLDVMADGNDLIASISMSGGQIAQLIASFATSTEVTVK